MKIAITAELRGKPFAPGFRPYVWSLASEFGVGGWISEIPTGARLHLVGQEKNIRDFLQVVSSNLAKYFRLKKIVLEDKKLVPDGKERDTFRLIGPEPHNTFPQPNIAPCPDCLRKMRDPESRYYHYPFISCEKCGPRYSVLQGAPFIRKSTSFLAFPPCHQCRNDVKEKNQPIASCPDCGPQMFLLDKKCEIPVQDPMAGAAQLLQLGRIVAVKTYNGFIILCNPYREKTLQQLRERKNMPDKPVTLLMRDMAAVRKYCEVSPLEEQLLTSPAAPVVLLKLKKKITDQEDQPLNPELLCPDNPGTVGVILPPASMLALIFDLTNPPMDVLAFTGGPHPVNPADAGGPADLEIVFQTADFLLSHDLKIWHNSGPSVQCTDAKQRVITLRRSGGLCPSPFYPAEPLKRSVLAFGTDTSAAMALAFQSGIHQSHQMGDIRSDQDTMAFVQTAKHLILMFARVPEMIVCDSERLSFSARRAKAIAEWLGLPCLTVQHHYANALTCLMEHKLSSALALVFDGGSNGPDGMRWGTELLEVTPYSYTHLASFAPFEGTKSHTAWDFIDEAASIIGFMPEKKTYQAQAAMRLHHHVSNVRNMQAAEKAKEFFPFSIQMTGAQNAVPTAFLKDFRKENFATEELAEGFLESMADAAVRMVQQAGAVSNCRDVLLSGKAFRLPRLTILLEEKLSKAGYVPHIHLQTSPDESSICIGQAYFGGMA